MEVAREAAALLLLRAHRELAGAAALLLDALEQAVERAGQAVDLLDRVVAAQLQRRRLGGVDRLDLGSIRRSSGRKRRWSIHRFVQSVSTIASARIRNSQRWSLRAEVEARGDARGEQREREQHDVRRDDLAYEGVVAACHAWSVHGSECARSGQMGSPPHIGRRRQVETADEASIRQAAAPELPHEHLGLGLRRGARVGAPARLGSGRPAAADALHFLKYESRPVSGVLSDGFGRRADPQDQGADRGGGPARRSTICVRTATGSAVIVDVREQHEFEEAHLPGAVHVPRGHLESRIEGAVRDRSQRVILYCASGNRSALRRRTRCSDLLGYEDVASMTRRHHALEGPRLRGRGPARAHRRAARALLAPPAACRRSASRAS